MKRFSFILLSFIAMCILFSGCGNSDKEDIVVLRVANWEEYIDEGGWDEEELIELDNGEKIIGEDPMVDEFEEWYKENYGVEVKVEYSCFGTNEDLYNQLTIGDTFDLICPSDYMIMKLMTEEKLVPYSKSFFDKNDELNYYARGVSDYIDNIFNSNEINGEPWSRYAAGYMWGTTGIVYNPEVMTKEEASRWSVLGDRKFYRQVTIKDNVRDSYFAALAIYKSNMLINADFKNTDDYEKKLAAVMNDTEPETIEGVEKILKDIKGNAYSFETDSAKADMIAGKVMASYQWSGDAVYVIDQASIDGVDLCYEVPEECGNLWFDGWVMLKDGIKEDLRKKKAAEAWVNYMSRPDNVVRNMYYIGYSSVIAGEKGNDTILNYINYNYAAEDDEEDTIDYDVTYFFGKDGEPEGTYVITAPSGAEDSGLGAQYPTLDTIRRCAVMSCFDDKTNEAINQMWINVRCFDITDI